MAVLSLILHFEHTSKLLARRAQHNQLFVMDMLYAVLRCFSLPPLRVHLVPGKKNVKKEKKKKKKKKGKKKQQPT
ncbi:hypothetical protein CGCF415_v014612 [Colletotrichum fructicola]|nr:hypothetical protein CGCF415_v014612 [Colletotrichum fructicola]